MNAKAILEKITQDARAQAADILREAQKQADELREEADRQVEAHRQQTVAAARREVAEQESRMQRMAELEQRKALLSAKREVMDEAFEKALSMMHVMKPGQARAYHLAQIVSLAQGDEQLVVGQPLPAWFDESFIGDVNTALTKAGRLGQIRLADSQEKVSGGFMLLREGLELNCSYEAQLKVRRMALEGEVAAVLFQ